MTLEKVNDPVPPLATDEQLTILEMARHRLRDIECKYRMEADNWHNAGAKIEAQDRWHKAEALDEAVKAMLDVEQKYRAAKRATYA